MKHASFLSFCLLTAFARAEIPPPSDAPKPLTPEQTAASYRLPDGFRLEVVACEPLIASPSAVCWDERGRMFVAELHGYNLEGQLDIEELNKTGRLDTQVRRVQADERFKKAAERGTFGVVKMLRDRDGDGRMDDAATWANDLPPAYGIVPARGGVIVACAPHIILLADRDGDGAPEVRETLFTGFATGALERGINTPQWGADGWIYFGRGWGGGKITGPKLAEPVSLPNADFRIRSDGSAIEPVTGGTHTFGFAMTAAGDRFVVNTTIPASFVAPLPWRYLVRNPSAAAPALESPAAERRAYSISKPHPWRVKRAHDPEYFKFYNSRYGAAESEADGWFTAACGPLVYLDRALPGLHGHYFVCEPAGNLIHRAVIEPDGAALKLRRAPGEEKSEFAATTDAWSHPMNLTHGPDGALWIVDYYREIIEDYSAIPRHLQQQYGVHAGHDRGRIYRLTHRDAPRAPLADMDALDAAALARECASPSLWRRQTAQRLLVERGEKSIAPLLREMVMTKNAEPSAVITALRTLDLLGVLGPDDVRFFFGHGDAAIRIHAWQIAERFFASDAATFDAPLAAAAAETNPRVLVQCALSLGESRDPRAFAQLVQFVRKRLDIRWIDAAVLSSIGGREGDMFAELLREPGSSEKFLPPLAQAIAASGDDAGLARALKLLGYAGADMQSAVLDAFAKGRKNALRAVHGDAAARAALAVFLESASPGVAKSAAALAGIFAAARVTPDATGDADTPLAAVEKVSDEVFRKFVAALGGSRDAQRGHEIFQQACATCHRVGKEGFEVGPDLLGQINMAEETLLRDILAPNERIRPGFETTQARLRDGAVVLGLLKDDGATSLTLVLPGGAEQILLRKEVAEVRRLGTSLMPAFSTALTPADLANLLAWLRSIR